jgi:hypothetical protein
MIRPMRVFTEWDHKRNNAVMDNWPPSSQVAGAVRHSRKCRTTELLPGDLSTPQVTRDDITRSNPRDYVVVCQYLCNRPQMSGRGISFKD